MRVVRPQVKLRKNKKYQLFDPDQLWNSSSTPSDLESHLKDLIDCLQDPLPSKYRKPGLQLLQVTLPGLLKLHRNNLHISSWTHLTMAHLCKAVEHRDTGRVLESSMELLSSPTANKEAQAKLIQLLRKTQMHVQYCNRAVLMRLIESVGSGEDEVRRFAMDSLEMVVRHNEKDKGVDCWLAVMLALQEATVKGSLKELMAKAAVVNAVKGHYTMCRDKGIKIPNFPELLLQGAYSGLLRDLTQQNPIGDYQISILLPLLQKPKLQYFQKLSQLYILLINSHKSQILLKALNVLRLHREIPLKDLMEKNSDQGYYNLSEFCKLLESILTSQKSEFLQALSESIIKQQNIFSLGFYHKLISQTPNQQQLYQILGKSFNFHLSNITEIVSADSKIVQIMKTLIDNDDDTEVSSFSAFIQQLNTTALLSLTTIIYLQYFLVAQKKNFHELSFVQEYLASDYNTWALLAKQIVRQKEIDLALGYFNLLIRHSQVWTNKFLDDMRLGKLLTLLNRKDIKSLSSFFHLVSRLPPSPYLARAIVPLFSTHFFDLTQLYNQKQRLVGQIMFSDGIDWSEQQRQSHIQLMQIQGKLSVNLIYNLLKSISNVDNLGSYLTSPDNISTMLLSHLKDCPQKQLLYPPTLLILSKIQPLCSHHSLSSHLTLTLKPKHQAPLKQRNLSIYSFCLHQLALYKISSPQLTHDWLWHSICEMAMAVLNVRECTSERDVMVAKRTVLRMCAVLVWQVDDCVFARAVIDVVLRVLVRGEDRRDHGVAVELRSEALCLLAQLLRTDSRNKKQRLEGIMALQYIAIDQCLQLRTLLLKLCLQNLIPSPSILLLILKTDPNPLLSTLSSYYLKQFLCEPQLNSFCDLTIHFAFLLRNHDCPVLKDRVRSALLGLLNADTLSIVYSLLQVLKGAKLKLCRLEVGVRVIYAREEAGKGSLDGLEEAVLKRAQQGLKLKGIRHKKLEIMEHELVDL